MAEQKSLSIIIPAYNEASNINQVLNGLKDELKKLPLAEYEIIVVNDASTDETRKILSERTDVRVIDHPYNKGYGAALKTGTRNAKHDWLLTFDADGQHNPQYILDLLKYTDNYDLIAGDRTKSQYVRPSIRKPGLWLLKKIANYLVDYKIPDLNCGMRLLKKEVFLKFLHLMPDTFSISTTTVVGYLKEKRNIKFVSMEVNKRNSESKSMVKPSDAIRTLMLIFRLIMLFSPLRIFLPASIILFIIGLGFLTYDLYLLNISESTIFILITSILIFFFGLMADQIAAIRREINK